MSQMDDVEQFVAQSRAVVSSQELHNLLESITITIGFDYFALVQHVDLSDYDATFSHVSEAELIAITNYPESWVEQYVADNIVANDPILLASQRSAAGFAWEDTPKLITVTNEHRAITERTRKAGVINGFTVPAHVPGEANGSCNFALGSPRALPQANLLMAQVVGSYAFQAARDLVKRSRPGTGKAPSLTDRQRDCVQLAAQGLSDGVIAQRLAISHETVKQHLKDARLRLGASNRAQLVIRAAYCGLIPLNRMVSP